MELYDCVTQSVVNIHALDANTLTTTSGTGFLIDPSHIVTSAHVVVTPSGNAADVIEISVFTRPNEKIFTTLLGASFENDVAVLDVSSSNTPLSYANYTPRKGQVVYTLGNLLGNDARAFTTGTIRSNEFIDINDPRYLDQIDVEMPIGSGNSGAPIFDQCGNVLGMVVSVVEDVGSISTSTTAAISTKYLQVIASDIISGTRTVPYDNYRVWVDSSLGLVSSFILPFSLALSVYSDLTGTALANAVKTSNLNNISGIIINAFQPDSPVANYLKANDIITAINGQALGYEPGQSTLGSALFNNPPGTTVTITARLEDDGYASSTSFQVQTIALPIDSTNIPGPGRKVSSGNPSVYFLIKRPGIITRLSTNVLSASKSFLNAEVGSATFFFTVPGTYTFTFVWTGSTLNKTQFDIQNSKTGEVYYTTSFLHGFFGNTVPVSTSTVKLKVGNGGLIPLDSVLMVNSHENTFYATELSLTITQDATS